MAVTKENYDEIKRYSTNEPQSKVLSRYRLSPLQAKFVRETTSFEEFTRRQNAYAYNRRRKVTLSDVTFTDKSGNTFKFTPPKKPIDGTTGNVPSGMPSIPKDGTLWFTSDQLTQICADAARGRSVEECSLGMGFKSASGLYVRLKKDSEAKAIFDAYWERGRALREKIMSERLSQSHAGVKRRRHSREVRNTPTKEEYARRIAQEQAERRAKKVSRPVEIKVENKEPEKVEVEVVKDDNYAGSIDFYKNNRRHWPTAVMLSSITMSALMAGMNAIGLIEAEWIICMLPFLLWLGLEVFCVFLMGMITLGLFGHFPHTKVKVNKQGE